MSNPRERLIEAREALGKSPDEMAELTPSVSGPNYWDLESYDDEVFSAISLGDLRDVCRALRINFTYLFGSPSTSSGKPLDFAALAEELRKHLSDHNQSADEFGEKVGWGVEGFLERSDAAWEWSVECLHDVCDGLGIDWLRVLAGVS